MKNNDYFIIGEERLGAKRAKLEMLTSYTVRTAERLLDKSEEILELAEEVLDIGESEINEVSPNYQNK